MNRSRRKNRLAGYDYSQEGLYFLTICTKDSSCILWEDGTRSATGHHLSPIGKIVESKIEEIVNVYEGVTAEIYAIMPNHVHLIIGVAAPEVITISRVVKQFKGSASKSVGTGIWQRSFHDRIIRNEREHRAIWQYIDENPAMWCSDEYYRTSW